MPIINVPGHGRVRFPDSMSMEDINRAIQSNTSIKQPSSFSQNHPVAQSIYNLLGGAAQSTINAPAMLYNTANTLQSLLPMQNKIPYDAPYLHIPGVEQNAISTTIGEILPASGLIKKGAEKGIQTASKFLMPLKHAENEIKPEIERLLGKSTTSSINTNLENAIDKVAEKKLIKSKALYKPILDKYGNNKFDLGARKDIYSPTTVAYKNVPAIEESYLGQLFKNEKLPDDLKRIYKKFEKDPTISNAHKLQSDMKKAARDYSSILNNQADKAIGNELNIAAIRLTEDIKQRLPERAAKRYEEASEHFLENVIPYRENSTLRKITQTRGAGKQNLHEFLLSSDEDARQVVKHLLKEDPDALNKIAIGALSKGGGITSQAKGGVKISPDNLSKAINNTLTKIQGIDNPEHRAQVESIFTPKLQNEMIKMMGLLENAEKTNARRKKYFPYVAGTALGGTAVEPAFHFLSGLFKD